MGTIRLGLERISRLMQDVPLTWRAIHVAGTNGKGSICSYLSSILDRCHVRSGLFTSPHTIHRWDGISIGGSVVKESVFHAAEARVKQRDRERSTNASDFEILTATAFEIFNQEKVEIGIVECGMGGLTDATNIVQDPIVTVISNISLDHQSFLGNTIEEIAQQKAGIIKPGCPCVVNGSNQETVLAVLRKVARSKGSRLELTPHVAITARLQRDEETLDRLFQALRLDRDTLEVTQQRNILCTFYAVLEAFPALQALHRTRTGLELSQLVLMNHAISSLKESKIPGRYQWASLMPETGRIKSVLIDGAHNQDAWEALARYRSQTFGASQSVTWIMAISNGRSIDQAASLLLQPQDSVVFTEFGAVDGMPWVKPVDARLLAEQVTAASICRDASAQKDVRAALQRACDIAEEGPLIIAGSLYLVSDVLRACG